MYPGTDIIEISRFRTACRRHPGIIPRLFTAREIENNARKNDNSLAARFAGKEAVLKALGTGLRGLTWHDIEIMDNEKGEPLVYLSLKAQEIARTRGRGEIRLSLSHSRDYAVAVAILI